MFFKKLRHNLLYLRGCYILHFHSCNLRGLIQPFLKILCPKTVKVELCHQLSQSSLPTLLLYMYVLFYKSSRLHFQKSQSSSILKAKNRPSFKNTVSAPQNDKSKNISLAMSILPTNLLYIYIYILFYIFTRVYLQISQSFSILRTNYMDTFFGNLFFLVDKVYSLLNNF